MLNIAVIEDAKAAALSLDPLRSTLLAELREPASASQLAERLGLPRQKLGYHLKMLEEHGLVELVDTRRRGNMTERLVRATAKAFVISPQALPELAPDPGALRDQASAWWMLALAARLVRELGRLIVGAAAAKQQLPVFAIDAEITFADARSRAAFSAELGTAMADLVAKYHDGTAPKGRQHRVLVALHPKPKEKQS